MNLSFPSPTLPDDAGRYGGARLSAAFGTGGPSGASIQHGGGVAVIGSPLGMELDADTLSLAGQVGARLATVTRRALEEIRLFADGLTDDEIGRAFFDPAQFPQVRAAVNRAAQELGTRIVRAGSLSTNGAFPQRDGDLTEVFYRGSAEPVDLSWAFYFAMEDYRSSTESYFEVGDVDDAVAFRTYAEGERVELVGISGAIQGYPFQNLGGGFQYSANWERDNKLWKIPNGLLSMQTGYGNGIAALMWQILVAAGLPVTARVAGATVVESDIRSINAAMVEILSDLYDAEGYRPANPVFGVAFNGLAAGYGERMAAMQAAQYGIANPVLGGLALAKPIVPTDSPNVPTGGFYVFLPGRRIKGAIRQDLIVYPKFDPTTNTDARIGWGRVAGVRGSTRQGRFVPGA